VKWFHLIFGILLFIVFTVTGRYMRVDFPDKDAIDQFLRVLMRSRHIYILFSALIHLALGVYMQLRPQTWRKFVQIAGSVTLVAASVLLVYAWQVETYDLQQFSELSRNGIYLSLAGVGLHLIGGVSLSTRGK
jgi:Mn2+/Fe2+ NRAMP family transporter